MAIMNCDRVKVFRHGLVLGVVLVSGMARAVFAVDGVVLTGEGHRYGFRGSYEVSAYTIRNSQVTDVRNVLPAADKTEYFSPAFNLSGTHFACVRVVDGTRWMIAVNVETGAVTPLVEVGGTSSYQVWWLIDGSIAYWAQGTYELRTVNFDPQADRTVITDNLHALFGHEPQGRYVGLSGSGRVISYRIYGHDHTGENKQSSSALGPVPTDGVTRMATGAPGFVGACGCGNAVSASGTWAACLQGSAHQTIGVEKVDKSESYGVLYSDIRSWASTNFGTGGDANRYSVNSDNWIATMVGIDDRFLRAGAECVVFHRDVSRQKAINVTNFKDRGISNAAFVGSFWLSSRDQVNDELWHFVENRNQWGAFWNLAVSGAAATPPTDMTGRSVSPVRAVPGGAGSGLRAHGAGGRIHLRAEEGSVGRVSVYDAAGRNLYRGRIPLGTGSIAAPAPGLYVLEAGERDGVRRQVVPVVR